MHLKVFVKLKKTLKTLSSRQKNQKKNPKNPKNQKKTKKTQKNPLGWVFLKKPGFFPTLILKRSQIAWPQEVTGVEVNPNSMFDIQVRSPYGTFFYVWASVLTSLEVRVINWIRNFRSPIWVSGFWCSVFLTFKAVYYANSTVTLPRYRYLLCQGIYIFLILVLLIVRICSSVGPLNFYHDNINNNRNAMNSARSWPYFIFCE